MVLKPAAFLVETVEAGLGEVLVYVEDPEGHTEEVHTHIHTRGHLRRAADDLTVLVRQQARVTPVNDVNRRYSVVYLPKVEGLHKVITSDPPFLCLLARL